jgi:hypothetical protein
MMAAALALALIAPAEQQGGTRVQTPNAPGPSADSLESGPVARRVMAAFARCILSRSRRDAEQFLGALPRSVDADRLASRIVTHECVGSGRLQFSSSLFRGALYEVLYLADFARRHPALADAPVVTYTSADPATLTDHQRGWLALARFGDCVVRALPAQARALVVSEVDSDSEQRAFAALMPALGGCLVQGSQLSFSRPMLRGVIAESLYRLSIAAAAVPSAGATR